MSKAEERALELYPVHYIGYSREGYGYTPMPVDGNSELRCAYLKGYYQAEEDLALSWVDIQTICKIESEVDAQYCKDGVYSIPIDNAYKEVLRRFNEEKGG